MALHAETASTSKRGFAAMSPEKRRQIAAKGGAAVPPEKRSFSQNRDLAASAGRAGGSSNRSRAEA
ncbi:stress-induced protein [Caulobacter flavus]|uniref:Stress-induced protein n=1 Tax=Caulobacter flavus TaxID=1679497 RepID=A0A2N5CP43_9CAUL|nr:KGG domain-containing protein [Caulobacter flavus]AYV48563.1 stress-induced protein [Caulobacter flavus]PLR08720.1 stress-induced protein [Caulobacter flavus]